jgi:hypothetical protein
LIKNTDKSIIRYGDGEISLLLGKSIHWQKYSYNLSLDLLTIIKDYSKDSPYILCIPNHRIQANNQELRKTMKLHMWLPFRILFKSIFPNKVIYGNAILFRYMGLLSMNINKYFENLNIIFVANEKVASIANVKSSKKLTKIIVPSKNAYIKKKEIMEKIKKNLSQYDKTEIIVLLSCGPLAKVLAFELSIIGYRAIDLGHIFEMRTKQRFYPHRLFLDKERFFLNRLL